MPPILTLTTDFGHRDPYVAAMKGVLLSLAPNARLVDISHDVTPQDVMEAAYILQGAVPYFPAGTIHLVVVDPGVGTARHPVALQFNDQYFVGADNGLFTLLLQGALPAEAVTLSNPAYWRTASPSQTFHGRDIFAPVAAHLANGVALNELGPPLQSLVRLQWAMPIADAQGIQGWIVHVDHFGNCITNISADLFAEKQKGRAMKCYIGHTILRELHPTYAAVASGEPLLLVGSNNHLEVAVHKGNAANLLSIHKGAPISVVFLDERT